MAGGVGSSAAGDWYRRFASETPQLRPVPFHVAEWIAFQMIRLYHLEHVLKMDSVVAILRSLMKLAGR